VEIDLAALAASADGAALPLTPQEFALLAHLVGNPEQAWSRDALLSRVWGARYEGGPRTVDVHVRRLRAKLGPARAQALQTIQGVGYAWRAPSPVAARAEPGSPARGPAMR
jgi:DNA-binding response OmpR family regulator